MQLRLIQQHVIITSNSNKLGQTLLLVSLKQYHASVQHYISEGYAAFITLTVNILCDSITSNE